MICLLVVPSLSRQEWQILGAVIAQARDALRSALSRHYLHVMDCLLAIEEPHANEQLAFWHWLAGLVDIKEEELRAAREKEALDLPCGVVGCSWSRCLLGGRQTTKEMFLCAGSQKVKYCGLFCQERCDRFFLIPET